MNRRSEARRAALVLPSPILVVSFAERRSLIECMSDEGLFRADAAVDVLARPLWS